MGEETQTEPQAQTQNDLIPKPAPRSAVEVGSKPSALVPRNLPEAMQLASMIANSGMAPKAYQDKDGTVQASRVLVGIMAGAEVGLAPFQALQSIAVIGNMPALWGDGALALILSSNLCVGMDEQWDEQRQVATCIMERVGRANPIVREFGMEDAKKAGLAGKQGPWREYPKRMCQMRARSWAMRDGFADVLKGLAIAEEARDIPATDGGQIEGQKVKLADLRTQAASAQLSAEDEASLEDDAAFLRGDGQGQALPEASDELREAPGVDTVTDDNPSAGEGPGDEERGEAHTGAEPEAQDQKAPADETITEPDDGVSPAEREVLKQIGMCARAQNAEQVAAIVTRFGKHESAFSTAQIARIETALRKARERLGLTS